MRFTLQCLNLLNAYETIDERLPRLTDFLDNNPPTVFAAQEVLTDPQGSGLVHLPTAAAFTTAGLTLAVAGAIRSGHHSGNAIWYDQERLQLLTTGELTFPHVDGLRFQSPSLVYGVFRNAAGSEVILFNKQMSGGVPAL